ncbi:MAG: flippase [bacterium]
MSQKVINIARNTSYYTLALIVQKVISFSYFVIIARALGPDDLGRYYFAISFTTIFAVLIDFGLVNVLTREVARDQNQAQKYLQTTLAIKLLLTVLTLGLVIILTRAFNYSPLLRSLIYISMVSMVLDSFTLTFFGVMRGYHNLKFESIASIIFQVIVFMSGLVAMKFGFGLTWLVGALALASVFNFLYSMSVVIFIAKIPVRLAWDFEFIKKLTLIVIPFFLFAIFQRIYTYIDSVMLLQLSGDRSVGIYQVAFKIIFALQFLPMAFSASLYPAFSSYWKTNKPQLAVTFERAINYLLIISVPISIGIYVLADKIVLLFNTDYLEAIVPLQITIASLIFVFLNFALGALLNACDRQVVNTKIIAFAATLCIVINWLLIPRFGAVGATISDAITNAAIFLVGLFFLPSIISINYQKLLRQGIKIFFGGLIMGLIANTLKHDLNIFLVIILAAIAYFVFLFVLQVFRKEDVRSIIASFSKSKV